MGKRRWLVKQIWSWGKEREKIKRSGYCVFFILIFYVKNHFCCRCFFILQVVILYLYVLSYVYVSFFSQKLFWFFLFHFFSVKWSFLVWIYVKLIYIKDTHGFLVYKALWSRQDDIFMFIDDYLYYLFFENYYWGNEKFTGIIIKKKKKEENLSFLNREIGLLSII